MRLELKDVDHYATGAAFLGTGGGGDPYIGSLLLRERLQLAGPLELLDADDIDDDGLFFVSAMIGAPTVMMEKLPNGNEAIGAIRVLEDYLGQKADGVLAAEIGGLNAVLPLVVASTLDLPVVDGDGMGRAFPELQMVTFSIMGNPSTPLTLADEFGNTVLVSAGDDKAAERLARSTVVAMGGSALMACYPMQGAEVKRTILRGTLSAALGIGEAIHAARSAEGRVINHLIAALRRSSFYQHAGLLFEGKIVDLIRKTTAGFAVGEIQIQGIGEFGGKMQIRFQNENLIAYRDDKVSAVVPDLICIVDYDTAEPITTEGLRYGQRVSVVGVAAPAALRSTDALKVVGPQCFGLTEAFVPVEKASSIATQNDKSLRSGA